MNASISSQQKVSPMPLWFWLVAGLGLAWSIFGAVQFVASLNATSETLVAGGMTPEQAAVMLGYPSWMTVAFAIGVFGGVIGCAFLLLRNRLGIPVFAVSLAGYVVLYIGDITEGVFAALGAPQVIILTMVVAIAGGLFWTARTAARRGILK